MPPAPAVQPSAPPSGPTPAQACGTESAKTAGCCACSVVAWIVAAGLAIAGIANHVYPLLIFALVLAVIGAICGVSVLRGRMAKGYYEIVLDPLPQVGLGDSAQWGLTLVAKRSFQVGTVTCTLRCQEHAISRGGTSDSHYRNTLYEQTFRIAGRPMLPTEQAAFRVPFTIPPDAVPSHRSSNNFIEWQLQLHAPVPGWCPDVKQTVDLWVAPTVSGALVAGHPQDASIATGWLQADRVVGGQAQCGAAWGSLQSQDGAMLDQTPVMSAGETRNLYLWLQTTEEVSCRGIWVWVGCRVHGSGTDEEIPLIAEHCIHEGALQAGQPLGAPLRVAIPAHGPVTFVGRYVKLEWVARVRFDVPLWFDKRMWVPIIVTPRRLPEPGQG
jgi:hypothetical protein